MKHKVLQSTLRELQWLMGNPRVWLVFAAVVVLFTVTGPFGTYDSLALPARLGYWLIVHALAWALALFFVTLFDAGLEHRIHNALARMLIGATISALPIGAMLTAVNGAFRSAPVTPGEVGANTLTALPISLILCVLAWMALDGTRNRSDLRTGEPEPPTPAAAPRPAILDRLQPEKRGALIRLEVQDHYVQVVTTRGHELILMRLADAIREAAPVDGRQVHRSHWVARSGIAALVREPGRNGRSSIETLDGAVVPVSRAHLSGVRAWAAETVET